MRRQTKFFKERSPRILMVDSDTEHGNATKKWLEEHEMKTMWVQTPREAMDLLYDMVFIESSVDGVLVEHSLPETSGCRVIQEFRHEFPGMAAALMTSADDISLETWSRARRIPIMRRPVGAEALSAWVNQFKVPA
jgi:DNA-binding response OmpR family regulator